jgi:hypothetical protein
MGKRKDKNFRTEIYFVGGKRKKRRIPLVDGLDVDEFIRRNADDAFLLENGYFEILGEREAERNGSTAAHFPESAHSKRPHPGVPPTDHDQIPF